MVSILNKHKNYIFLFLSIIIAGSLIATSNTGNIFGRMADHRTILSSLVFVPSEFPNESYHFFKIINDGKISIEIYSPKQDGSFNLVSRFNTNTKYDGYFLLGGNATNFAAIRPAGNSLAQIISPGFDKNLIAYLNVIEFNPVTKTFTFLESLPAQK